MQGGRGRGIVWLKQEAKGGAEGEREVVQAPDKTTCISAGWHPRESGAWLQYCP